MAIVTGAGGAIAGQIARGLSEAGTNVAIWDLSLEAAQRKAEAINGLGNGRAIAVQCDVTSPEMVEEALGRTLAEFHAVDFLLLDEATGELTSRAQSVLATVPMGRFGNPEEIVGCALGLESDGRRCSGTW